MDDSSRTDSAVTIRFAGDCLLAGYYEADAGEDVTRASGSFDLLRTADLSMVNLECPVTVRGMPVPKPYNFRMHPKYLKALVDAGIDLVNIANNHVFDYGEEGLFDTISYLDSVGVRHVGAGRNLADASRPVIIHLRGIRIGFLGFYGGGEAPAAGREKSGVNRRELSVIRSQIRSLKDVDSVDLVIVSFHWGAENADTPGGDQQWFARRVIDAGADVIVGHHPHVLQGIERYKSGVIAYSLGNFIFGGNSRDSYDTGVFEVRLDRHNREYRFIPVRVRNWNASVLTGEDGRVLVEKVKRLSSKFPRSIFTN